MGNCNESIPLDEAYTVVINPPQNNCLNGENLPEVIALPSGMEYTRRLQTEQFARMISVLKMVGY